MKQVIFTLIAAVAILAATSCSEDEHTYKLKSGGTFDAVQVDYHSDVDDVTLIDYNQGWEITFTDAPQTITISACNIRAEDTGTVWCQIWVDNELIASDTNRAPNYGCSNTNLVWDNDKEEFREE